MAFPMLFLQVSSLKAQSIEGDRWGPCTCTTYYANGTIETSSACNDPQPDGDCDRMTECVIPGGGVQ